jgi:hypothetical protein
MSGPEKAVCVPDRPTSNYSFCARAIIPVFILRTCLACSRPEPPSRVGGIRAKRRFRCTKNIFYHVQPPFRRGWGNSFIYTRNNSLFLYPYFGHQLSVVQSHSLQPITPLQDFRIEFYILFFSFCRVVWILRMHPSRPTSAGFFMVTLALLSSIAHAEANAAAQQDEEHPFGGSLIDFVGKRYVCLFHRTFPI